MTKVFVSYAHADSEWVWGRLKPCLEAGGAEMLIDRERFRAGLAVVGQMDAVQDQAERHVLVITERYLASDACRHEMERAVALDPGFTREIVVPVRRDDHKPWPDAIARPNPLYVDLRRDSDAAQWKLLLQACDATLGTTAPEWLAARDEIVRALQRHASVNLVVDNGVPWRPLLDHLRNCALPQHLLPDLKVVDLDQGATASRRGLLESILRALSAGRSLPDKPHDLVEFDRVLESMPVRRLAFTHFDHVTQRQAEYGLDLFASLRYRIMTEKRLALLLVSRRPFATLLPPNNELSQIAVSTVELRARP